MRLKERAAGREKRALPRVQHQRNRASRKVQNENVYYRTDGKPHEHAPNFSHVVRQDRHGYGARAPESGGLISGHHNECITRPC